MSKLPAKKQLIEKIVELSALIGITGELTDDGQCRFIAHMTMTILTASQKESHARLLVHHLENFIKEVDVIDGKKTAVEFFAEKEACQN